MSKINKKTRKSMVDVMLEMDLDLASDDRDTLEGWLLESKQGYNNMTDEELMEEYKDMTLEEEEDLSDQEIYDVSWQKLYDEAASQVAVHDMLTNDDEDKLEDMADEAEAHRMMELGLKGG